MTDYLIMSQMSLLSMIRLRELDLVPDRKILLKDSKPNEQFVVNSFTNFDKCLLKEISRYVFYNLGKYIPAHGSLAFENGISRFHLS